MVSKRFQKMIQAAKDEASDSESNSQHGAIVFKGNKILSSAHNTSGNRIMRWNVPACHAEANALAKLKWVRRPRVLQWSRDLQWSRVL